MFGQYQDHQYSKNYHYTSTLHLHYASEHTNNQTITSSVLFLDVEINASQCSHFKDIFMNFSVKFWSTLILTCSSFQMLTSLWTFSKLETKTWTIMNLKLTNNLCWFVINVPTTPAAPNKHGSTYQHLALFRWWTLPCWPPNFEIESFSTLCYPLGLIC